MFLNNWGTLEDMIADFWPNWGNYAITDELVGVTILLASYATYSYEGDAFVLFVKEGALYEVNASHCSCYGLEGQWDPEETTIEALRYRMNNGRLGKDWPHTNIFAEELAVVLDTLEQVTPYKHPA